MKKAAGWLLLAISLLWLAFAFLHGGHFFFFQKIEVSLRDPVFALWRAAGLAVPGLLLLGKEGWFRRLFLALSTKRGLLAFTLLTFLLFTALSLLRFYSGNSAFGDMALFEGYFQKLASGREPWVYINARAKLLWSDHVYFLYPLLALVYKFFGMAGVIVATRALLASAAPLAFWLGKELDPERRGVLVALAGLAPAYLGFYLGDPYIEPLVFPLGIGLLAAYERKNWPAFWAFAAGFPLLREDAPFVLAGLGLLLAIKERRFRWLGLSALALGLSFGLMAWQRSIGGPNFAEVRLAARFGLTSLFDLKGLLGAGLRVFSPLSLLGFLVLSLGFGPLSFGSWRGLLAGFVSAAPHMASRYYRQGQLRGYFGLWAYPALLWGVYESLKKVKNPTLWGALGLAFAGLLGPRCFLRSFDPGPYFDAVQLVKLVPPNAAVATTPTLAPAAAPRDTVYLYPWAGARFVLFDEADPLYEAHGVPTAEILDGLLSSGYEEVARRGRVRLLELRQRTP